jgi:hypothetical protein
VVSRPDAHGQVKVQLRVVGGGGRCRRWHNVAEGCSGRRWSRE